MPEQLLVPIKRLDETLEVPRYAYEGDAGVDLRAAEDFSLKPFERKLVPTGIAIALPRGYAGFVMPRSGLAVDIYRQHAGTYRQRLPRRAEGHPDQPRPK